MAQSQKKQIETWARRLFFANTGAQKVVKLELAHVGTMSKKSRVGEFPIEGSEGYEDLASQILTAAEIDADGIGGLQKYAVLAYRANDSSPFARHTFRLRGRDDDSGDEFESEEATPKGLLSQQMRHTEAMARLVVGQTEGITRQLVRSNELLTQRLEQLESRNIEQMGIMERMLSEEKLRELEERRQKAEEDNKAALISKLDLLLPVVANRIAGKNILPADTEGNAIKAFLTSITPQQLNALASVLTPEQAIVVMELYNRYSPPKDDEAANRKGEN